jgi:hypothetical protein
VHDSMAPEERERYAQAFNYAVVERDAQFGTADEFADWWSRAGWAIYSDDIGVGFFNWRKPPMS